MTTRGREENRFQILTVIFHKENAQTQHFFELKKLIN